MPDEMKGHIPFAFVALENPPDDLLKDLNQRLRKNIGTDPVDSLHLDKPC